MLASNYKNMDKRKITGILIILIGLITIVFLIYFMFFRGQKETVVVDPISDNSQNQNNIDNSLGDKEGKKVIDANFVKDIPPKNTENRPDPRSKVDIEKEDLKRIASSFAERFGSYSNQSNYGNILDLRMFMSDKMRNWADDFVAEKIKETSSSDIYYGIITQTSLAEISEYDNEAGLATILVHTRRREAVGASANFSDVYNQEIVINFIKVRGAWKVDSANWK